MTEMLHGFTLSGPNGEHRCMVFEVMGVNMLTLIRNYGMQGVPLPLVRRIAVQLLLALDFLHVQCGVIHTDLKPENVLLSERSAPGLKGIVDWRARRAQLRRAARRKAKEDPGSKRLRPSPASTSSVRSESTMEVEKLLGRQPIHQTVRCLVVSCLDGVFLTHSTQVGGSIVCKVADLGNACWVDRHFSTEIQTRQYRSPEVILGAEYGTSADMFSVACLLFEVATGDQLFSPKSGRNYSRDDDHLAQMLELTGSFPATVSQTGKRAADFFDSKGNLRRVSKLRFWPLAKVLSEKYKMRAADARKFATFLLPMLNASTDERATAREALRHPWLADALAAIADEPGLGPLPEPAAERDSWIEARK